MFNFRKLFNIYNLDSQKVIVFLGCKIRIRSKLLMLRQRMGEAEKRNQQLEKELQAHKAHFATYQRLIEQKLAELEDSVQTHCDCVEDSVVSVRQEMNRRAEQLSKNIHDECERLSTLQQRQLDSRCSANATTTQVVSQRLADLEQQASERFNALSCNLTESEKKWDTGLRRLRESVEINRDRLEMLEGLDLDTRCSQNADATREVSARLADLEQLNLGAICELNRQEVAAVEKRISAIESQKLDEACEQNRQATAAVEERLSAIESQKLDEACEQNREAANKIGQRVAQLEHLNLGEACARQAERLQMVENRVAAQEQQQLGEKVAEQRAALQKMNELMAGVQKRVSPLANPKAFNYIRAKGFIGINRDYVASQVENIYEKGISEREGEPRLVVSLTSYPKRMYDIHLCLYSLLTQDLKPDKIILWLGKEQFPHKSKDIPKKVRELKKWGLEIKWCEDTKSYKKLIPALQQYPDAVIVTADDDIYYPPHWLRTLWETHQTTGAKLVANRCHRVSFEGGAFQPYSQWRKCVTGYAPSYMNFMTGAGGILYAPGCFGAGITDINKAMELCPHGDDIWFWAMALLNGTKIALPENPINGLIYTNPEREANVNDDGTLFSSNGSGGNDEQLKALLSAYPELAERLQSV